MFILANGIARGRAAGVVATAGMPTGLAGHTVAAALGPGAVLSRSAKDVAATAPASSGGHCAAPT